MAKKKFYVVWAGRRPGIYTTWAECAAQVNGYKAARYKAFSNESLARQAFDEGWQRYVGQPAQLPSLPPEVIADSISVDAACDGSPGKLEYKGVHTATGEALFYAGPIENGTNNLGEFLAIVHALRLLTSQGKTSPVYSDSRNALLWVERKYVGSKLPRNEGTQAVWTLADSALIWLKANSYPNELLKWQTAEWGEIRADFGRK
jgi:ribonuclease HI